MYLKSLALLWICMRDHQLNRKSLWENSKFTRNINERSSGSVWISAWYRPNEINQRVAARRKGTQNISVACLVQTLGANACLPRRDTPNDTVNNRLDGPAKCTDSLLAHRHAFVIYRSRHVRLSRFPLLAFTILFAFFYLLEEQRE